MKLLNIIVLPIFFILTGCTALDTYDVVRGTILDPTDVGVKVVKHDAHHKITDNSKGYIYVTWYSTFAKAKHYMSGIYIYINNKPTSAVTHGTYTVIEVEPGNYEIAVGDMDSKEEVRTINIAAGQIHYFDTGIRSNLIMPDSLYLIKEEDSNQARKRVDKSTYVSLQAL